MMKRFRLNIALLLCILIILVSVATWLYIKGQWAPATISLIFGLVTICIIWNLQTRLIRTMSTYVKALEMNDTGMRVEVSGDNELQEMSDSMNRISELYSNSLRELETRKYYYDRILKIMTHEMRNGITPVMAMASDIENHPADYYGEQLTEAAGLIYSQAEGIKRFLDSYYMLTHLPEPEKVVIKGGDYFRTVRKLVSAELAQRGMSEERVSYTIAEEMKLELDSSLMNQVMMNLVRNALDAIAGQEDGLVEVVLTVSDGRPNIIVSDNGSGLTPEMMENLFQPFYTTKKGGSGVGLSLSRQIMRRHGGDLKIGNRPGKGVTAVATL